MRRILIFTTLFLLIVAYILDLRSYPIGYAILIPSGVGLILSIIIWRISPKGRKKILPTLFFILSLGAIGLGFVKKTDAKKQETPAENVEDSSKNPAETGPPPEIDQEKPE